MNSDVSQSDKFYEVLAWLEVNKQRLIVGASVALVVGFGIYTYRWKLQQTELAASDALLRLRPAAGSTEAPSAPKTAEYMKVAQEFSGTSAGQRALFLAAGALFADKKYAEAQAQFERFARENSGSPLAADAAFGAAAALDAQDKATEALAAYQSVLTRFPDAAVGGQVKLAMARINESKNQPAQALKLYDELTRATSLSAWSSEAAQKRELLLARNPELAAEAAKAAAAKVTVTPLATNALKAAVAGAVKAAASNAPVKASAP
jgi:predicted negative regulator of RcsB-dependent stress response